MAPLQHHKSSLQADYPWAKLPFIVSAPMARISKPQLAVAVSRAGGLGFIASGYSSDHLTDALEEATRLVAANGPQGHDPAVLPVGVGFITWSASLEAAIPAVQKYKPCAVWLFAPANGVHDLVPWATKIREVTSQRTKIWVQVGSVADAVEVIKVVQPDALVVQGSDAGGHSLARGASIVSLVPEIHDRIQEMESHARRPIQLFAAGGISDGRGVAAAIALGSNGCVLGTRFLASPESLIPNGYREAVIQASDGGVNTVRADVFDHIRGIYDWPAAYNGRGIINRTYIEENNGLSEKENQELYNKELEKGIEGYGLNGRLTTYAGTGVGLVRVVMPAGDIVTSLREDAIRILYKSSKL